MIVGTAYNGSIVEAYFELSDYRPGVRANWQETSFSLDFIPNLFI